MISSKAFYKLQHTACFDNFSTYFYFQVLLTSSEAVLSALPSPLLAEAQMLRNRAMSHYQARSLFGSTHRLNSRRNGLGFDRQSVMDRGVGVTIGQRTVSGIADKLKDKEIEGEPLLDASALKALLRLLLLAQVNFIGLFLHFIFTLFYIFNTHSTYFQSDCNESLLLK